MKKQIVMKAFKNALGIVKKHSPEILIGVGISGMIVTTVTAVKATPKALTLIDKKEIEEDKRLSSVEVIKTVWKCYVPSAITGILSVACIITATSMNSKRNAALAAAYAISETALKEYEDKTLEVVGDKKEQEIRDAIAKDQLLKVPIEDKKIFETGNGDVLFFEPLSGRYFHSDVESVRRAENNINRKMRDEVHVSLNDYYSELGLPEIDSNVGDALGWEIDSSRGGYVDIQMSWILDPPNREGEKTCVLGHINPPRYYTYY